MKTDEEIKVEARPVSGSSELCGYRVEARTSLKGRHIQMGDRIYGDDWSEITVHRAPVGIPSNQVYGRYLNLVDCLSYEQAMAIAWAFKAECEASAQYRMEVRLVRMKIFCSWKSVQDGFVQELPRERDVKFQKGKIVHLDGSVQNDADGPDDPLGK